MKERPILFSGPLVQAILDGRKTQTRRLVKPQPPSDVDVRRRAGDGYSLFKAPYHYDHWRVAGPVWAVRDIMGEAFPDSWVCPYGKPGDRLWVREAHASGDMGPLRADGPVVYRANYSDDDPNVGPWCPSIHMPRWASRIDLEVTGVRVERLQEITAEDARAEGIEADTRDCRVECLPRMIIDRFADLWDKINGKREGASWEANPWVWVVEFRRVRP